MLDSTADTTPNTPDVSPETDDLARASAASSRDEAKAVQEARAKKYGIGIKEGGNITKPADGADIPDSAYADPVNYRYPMKDKAHADNAAARWGDASNRAQYSTAEQTIISDRIAARQAHFGEDDKGADRAMSVTIGADGSHAPFTGSHKHAHHAYGSQGGDSSHEHSHSHDNDANHGHSHNDASAGDTGTGSERALASEPAHMYLPITRIDPNEWTIEGQATSDVVDHYGTIFDYESSKRAFAAWRGNIREMHQNKAVGRAIEITPDDDNHRIFIKARISRGAKDTWEKICDGTLSGFSIGVPSGKYKTRTVERGGRKIPEYYDHELAEVSVVDNPGSPGCDISIVRADGLMTDVLDNSEPAADATPTSVAEPEVARSGARISHVTQDALHQMRDGHLHGMKKAMEICQCDECQNGLHALDPDNDGDVDILGGIGDLDGDAGQSDMYAPTAKSDRALEVAITRILQQQLAPTLHRVNALCAGVAQLHTPAPAQSTSTVDLAPLERRLEAIEARTDVTEVRSLLSEVKGSLERLHTLTEQIAAQPTGGGPIMNFAAMDKTLATQAGGSPHSQQQPPSKAEIARLAAQAGLLQTEHSQLLGATAQISEIMQQQRSRW